jgi:hypothetical protein
MSVSGAYSTAIKLKKVDEPLVLKTKLLCGANHQNKKQ